MKRRLIINNILIDSIQYITSFTIFRFFYYIIIKKHESSIFIRKGLDCAKPYAPNQQVFLMIPLKRRTAYAILLCIYFILTEFVQLRQVTQDDLNLFPMNTQ